MSAQYLRDVSSVSYERNSFESEAAIVIYIMEKDIFSQLWEVICLSLIVLEVFAFLCTNTGIANRDHLRKLTV